MMKITKGLGKNRSRDLSEIFIGELEITIQDRGIRTVNLGRDVLANYVGTAQALINGMVVYYEEEQKNSWEIVLFDRATNKLIVRSVKV